MGFNKLENYFEIQYCHNNLQINIFMQINCISEKKTLIFLLIKWQSKAEFCENLPGTAAPSPLAECLSFVLSY